MIRPHHQDHSFGAARSYPQTAMVDLPADRPSRADQPPTLTELEAAQGDAAMAQRRTVEWLMASEEMPDVEVLLAELVSRPAWHRQAACRGADPALLFPERGQGHQPTEALAYCERCAVKPECLASGLEVGSTTGVWGGTTGRGRRNLRAGSAA